MMATPSVLDKSTIGALRVKRAAVLGAGVMGAQIAAHLVNADVETLLFELAAEGADPNASARRAIEQLARQNPPPLAAPYRKDQLRPANYDTDLERLRGCDLVIEAIAERIELKEALYARVGPSLAEDAVFVSNTSGLSINRLAKALPAALQPRFCGVHFFNPPRYMKLVELIPGERTEAGVLDRLEAFLVTTLGKGVVRAKDTPNFIGNRIGVFSMLATMHHAERLGLPVDVVDALTGTAIGRGKSATYRTLDIVGLDTMAHVVEGVVPALREARDPWVGHYRHPEWIHALLEAGALGRKADRGIYKREGKANLIYDPASGDYRPAAGEVAPEVQKILDMKSVEARFEALDASDHPQAQFLWAIHRDLFHYAAVLLEAIADNARDVDQAIRWGFAWQLGPFEIWQSAGWKAIAGRIERDIAEGRTMAAVPLPAWVGKIEAIHGEAGSWSPAAGRYRPRPALPVYQRQVESDWLAGEKPARLGDTIFDSHAVRMWHAGDDIAVLSFETKAHMISAAVLDGVLQAVEFAERDFGGLVLWHPGAPFSVGANLVEFVEVIRNGEFERLDAGLREFQHASMRLRYSNVPVVAAVNGLALGGGCEFVLHCDRVVAALESHIGLVEVGVGLVPGGGGCKELARRAAMEAPDGDPFPALRHRYFELVAMAKTSGSAQEARAMGLLRDGDVIIFNPNELLHVARAQARALAEAGYRAPLARRFPVAGDVGIASLDSIMVNMLAGGFISEYDHHIGRQVATILCGGAIDPGTLVDEQWLLNLERRAFIDLAEDPRTQARIDHMLKTKKPLRN
jgi:3-hydroxyacyl-CoA dehydrogenase